MTTRAEIIAKHRQERQRWYANVAAQAQAEPPPEATLREFAELNAATRDIYEDQKRLMNQRAAMPLLGDLGKLIAQAHSDFQADMAQQVYKEEPVPEPIEIPTPVEWVTREYVPSTEEALFIRKVLECFVRTASKTPAKELLRLVCDAGASTPYSRKAVADQLAAKGWWVYFRYGDEGWLMEAWPLQPGWWTSLLREMFWECYLPTAE